jgi:hypothetical protein
MSDFVNAQQTKTTAKFFSPVYEAWHKEYPSAEPTQEAIAAADGDKAKAQAIITKKEREVSISLISHHDYVDTMMAYLQRVYWWFHNHTRTSTSGTDARNTLKLSTTTRVRQPYQAYSKLYYETKLKDIIDEKYKEHIDTTPKAEQKGRFAFTSALTKSFYDAETDEIKNEVEIFRKKQVAMNTIKLEEGSETDEKMDAASLEERNRQMQS